MTPQQEATLQQLATLTSDAYMPVAAMEIAQDFLPLLLAERAALRAEVERLRDALDVIQAPLHIDGEEHRGAVYLARRVLKQAPASGEGEGR